MKKVFIAVAILLSLTATAQKKETIKQPIQKVISDTLEVSQDAKFILINKKIVPVKLLNDALVILDEKQLQDFLGQIQEYPAKFANPFTQYVIKAFNLKVQDAPKPTN